MNYITVNFDLENRLNPIAYTVATKDIRFSFGSSKEVFFHWKRLDFTTDEGWLVAQPTTSSVIDIHKIETDDSDRDSSLVQERDSTGVVYKKAPLITVYLYANNATTQISREYQRLINVISNIGGIIEIFIYLSVIIYSGYNHMSFEAVLINEAILNQKTDRKKGYYEARGEIDRRWGVIDILKMKLCCYKYCLKKKKHRDRYRDKQNFYGEC
jgi:hypothetical protein